MKFGNEIFQNISDKNHNSDLPILAITQEYGAIPRDLIDYKISVTDKSVDSYKVVQKGDFIISLRSFQGGIEYSEYQGICSPAYIILRPIITVDRIFYKYYLKTSKYITHLNRKLEGIRDGKMISYKYFSDISLPLPSIAEQNKISSFLFLIDSRIQTQKKIISHLQTSIQSYRQKIFSRKIRFKDISSKDYPDWEIKKLGEIAMRLTNKNKDNNQNVLTISAQYGLISQLEFFNKSVSAKNVTGYYVLNKNDFAYNKSYSNGYPMGAIKKLIKYEKGVVSTLYICFKFHSHINSEFMKQYFDAGFQNNEIEKIAQEGARNHGLLNIFIDTSILSSISESKDDIFCCSSYEGNGILNFFKSLPLIEFIVAPKFLLTISLYCFVSNH
ncbi:restriction endonuclease subunit S [Chryseobacterium sp. JJR-5R]|uniref:restriction endonuclease subunit S n=1 Tax=Chryseobacterium sp. JJR-5R TaxID=3093923 RepID=UPI002A75D251|nr:restriction endonuclease subunit S [Chryseobacterium sp. JJR-5R]WPO81417.1 restriction endonuclease subunit S [Chryseobacterium sp. JJR-5R]